MHITRLFKYIKRVNELKNNEDLRLILYIITFVQDRIYITVFLFIGKSTVVIRGNEIRYNFLNHNLNI